jgi:hypothetical protein
MGLYIRIILFIILLFLIEYYFVKKTTKTVLSIYSSLAKKQIKLYRNIALVFFNLYPLFVISLWTYQAIARPVNFSFPEGKIMDYSLIYPFWFFIILAVQCILLFLIIDIIKLFLLPLYKRIKLKILPYESR